MSLFRIVLALSISWVSTTGAAPTAKCPFVEDTPSYYLADSLQCDRYHQCKAGIITNTYLCDDGLVFDGKVCTLPYGVDCGPRVKMQMPKGLGRCPRRNGNYHMEGGQCGQYINCNGGSEKVEYCPQSLVFDEFAGTCIHSDVGCHESKILSDFETGKCPITTGNGMFAIPGECALFFYCSAPHYIPILDGCSFGTVFNEATQTCEDAKNVPGCEKFYKGA